MSTPSNDSPSAAPASDRQPLPENQAMQPSRSRMAFWTVRSELWENRLLYVAPLAIGGLVLLGLVISALTLPHRLRAASPDPIAQAHVLGKPYGVSAALLMVTVLLIGAFYCLEALHGERRDRSILFWKSMPVGDLTTVLSKASIPVLLLPAFTFVLIVTSQLATLLLSSVVLLTSGLPVAPLWNEVSLLSTSAVWLYALIVMALWHAPLYGWLLLVGAWARRLTFLWAILPLLALGLMERIVFHSAHFMALLRYRIEGGLERAFDFAAEKDDPIVHPLIGLAHVEPGRFLGSPGLWLGLLVAAAFLLGAARLRRYAEPM